MKNILIFTAFLFVSSESTAVNISTSGQGEFLLIPYYNITNGYNATVNVFNHDDKGKAVKVHIRESLGGHSVLSYNAYLAPKDSWTFALGPHTSTTESNPIEWHSQDSGKQVTFDQSCAPELIKSGHEFSGEKFNNPSEGTRNFSRTREGFIEIIEMATIDPESDLHHQLLADATGNPSDCQSIAELWQTNGDWLANAGQSQLLSPTGTLSADATLINVAEGIQFPIQSTVFSNFFEDGMIMHTAPDSDEPSLNAGMNTAFFINEGQILNLQFETGIDAISALLLKSNFAFQSNMEPDLAAATEVGITFPTRRFYVNDNNILNPPFLGITGQNYVKCGSKYSGSDMISIAADREGRYDSPGTGVATPPAQLPQPVLCGTTATLIVKAYERPINPIFSSENLQIINPPALQNATESGSFRLWVDNRKFSAVNLVTNQAVELEGIPVIGTAFQKASNANAAPGKLAQYGFSTPLKTYAQARIE